MIKPGLNENHLELLKIVDSDFRQTKQSKPTKKEVDFSVFSVNIHVSPQSLQSAKNIQFSWIPLFWFSLLSKVIRNV